MQHLCTLIFIHFHYELQLLFSGTFRLCFHHYVKNSRTESEKGKQVTSLCHITTCFEVIRGFSQFLQALVDAGPLEQATDGLLSCESRASHAIRRYITSAVRNALLNYFRIKFMSRTGVNECCQNLI